MPCRAASFLGRDTAAEGKPLVATSLSGTGATESHQPSPESQQDRSGSSGARRSDRTAVSGDFAKASSRRASVAGSRSPTHGMIPM